MSVIKTIFHPASPVTLQNHHPQRGMSCFCYVCIHRHDLKYLHNHNAHMKKHFFLWGWPNTCTSCPERLKSLCPCRRSKNWLDVALSSLLQLALVCAGRWTRWSPRYRISDSVMKATGQLRIWKDCGCTNNTYILFNLPDTSYFEEGKNQHRILQNSSCSIQPMANSTAQNLAYHAVFC